MKTKISIEDIAIFCKKKGFVFPTSEIYGGLSGFFDFGPLGVELKNNIKNLYIKEFVQKRENIVMQDGAIITNSNVWKASGHISNFVDLILTTEKTKTKIRADHFIEDKLNISSEGITAKEINNLIKKHNLTYHGENFEEVKDFNLMFSTQVGADTKKNSIAYLRPETCQNIFLNFKQIQETSRLQIPFGIVQIGKAFRNEISPRDFIFRCREFEQIEMEYFFNPDSKCNLLTKKQLEIEFQFLSAKSQENNENKIKIVKLRELLKQKLLNEYHAYWLIIFLTFFEEKIGLSSKNLRIREHIKTELSHYSLCTFDIEYNYPFGFKELFGLANRGDFDLRNHALFSKSNLSYFDQETKSKFFPNVIEPSLGFDRILLAVLTENFKIETETRGNIVLSFPIQLSPYKISIHPLSNKPNLVSISRTIYKKLQEEDIVAFYDSKGSIGRRYARADEIGINFNLTIDYQTIEEGKDINTITIRNRDTTEQKRVRIDEISQIILNLIKGKIFFEDLK